MTRDAFLARLREGLRGLAQAAVDEIVSDYAAHFAEGEAAGRSDAQIAQALGDPGRLARELRAEAGLKRWEERPNPTAAAGAVLAVLGLATVDILILLPILIGIGAALLGSFIASIAIFFSGAWVFAGGVSGGFGAPGPGSPLAAAFAGLGLMSGGVAAAAILSVSVIALVNLLVRYGRLHYQLLQPAP